jgi:KTSC domain-containing protein
MRKSTYLASISYDQSTNTMIVVFTDGAKIAYHSISARTYSAVATAKSPGEKFSEIVRDKYRFTILKQAA